MRRACDIVAKDLQFFGRSLYALLLGLTYHIVTVFAARGGGAETDLNPSSNANVLIGSTDETFERDGLRMTFHSQTHPLEDYARALEGAGLLIERVREPAVPQEAIAARASYQRWQRLPMFLHLRAIKR